MGLLSPGFVSKMVSSLLIALGAFSQPPSSSPAEPRFSMLCPVRAFVRMWTGRRLFAGVTNSLFHELSHWIVGIIALANSSWGLLAPKGLYAQSSRGMAGHCATVLPFRTFVQQRVGLYRLLLRSFIIFNVSASGARCA